MTEAEAKEILEHYISPNGVGFPDVKEAIAVLLKKALVQEPEPGRWIYTNGNYYGQKCSECGYAVVNPTNYCPNCGSKNE